MDCNLETKNIKIYSISKEEDPKEKIAPTHNYTQLNINNGVDIDKNDVDLLMYLEKYSKKSYIQKINEVLENMTIPAIIKVLNYSIFIQKAASMTQFTSYPIDRNQILNQNKVNLLSHVTTATTEYHSNSNQLNNKSDKNNSPPIDEKKVVKPLSPKYKSNEVTLELRSESVNNCNYKKLGRDRSCFKYDDPYKDGLNLETIHEIDDDIVNQYKSKISIDELCGECKKYIPRSDAFIYKKNYICFRCAARCNLSHSNLDDWSKSLITNKDILYSCIRLHHARPLYCFIHYSNKKSKYVIQKNCTFCRAIKRFEYTKKNMNRIF